MLSSDIKRLLDEAEKQWEEDVNDLFDEVKGELRKLESLGCLNSSYEGYALVLKELDKAWEAVKNNDIDQARDGMFNVAVMALRFIMDIKKSN